MLVTRQETHTHRQRLALAPAVQHPRKRRFPAIYVTFITEMIHDSSQGRSEGIFAGSAVFGPCRENRIGLR